MKTKLRSIYLLVIAIIAIFLLPSASASSRAVKHRGNAWMSFHWEGPISDADPNVLYLFKLQERMTNNEVPHGTGIAFFGLGYKSEPDVKLWLIYRFQAFIPEDSESMRYENRFAGNVTQKVYDNDYFQLVSRSMLELRKRTSNRQWLWRFRQGFKFVFHHTFLDGYTPIIFEEVLININRVSWTDNQTFEQHRVLVGFSRQLSSHTKGIGGYLNQFVSRRPRNKMNHIMYVELQITT